MTLLSWPVAMHVFRLNKRGKNEFILCIIYFQYIYTYSYCEFTCAFVCLSETGGHDGAVYNCSTDSLPGSSGHALTLH